MKLLEKPKEGNEVELGNRKATEDQIEALEEDREEDMELGKLDLDEIEKECDKKGRGYVSRQQLELLQEEFIKTKAH